MIFNRFSMKLNSAGLAGIEPAIFGLEVQRVIHCATDPQNIVNLKNRLVLK